MNKTLSFTVLLSLIISSSLSFAETFKWIDKEGNVSYSDHPPFQGAKKLDAPLLSTVPAVKTSPKKITKKSASPYAKDKATTKYTSLSISSPKNDATIRNNNGEISVSIRISPALNTKKGHYLSLNMDGKVIQSRLNSTSTSVSNVDRGTHNLSITVKNKAGKTLKTSQPVTVYIHRQSIL